MTVLRVLAKSDFSMSVRELADACASRRFADSSAGGRAARKKRADPSK